MTKSVHQLYISILVLIVVVVTVALFYMGFDYYGTSIEERFYHAHHDYFKPSGILGHGLGVIGTLIILVGVFGYRARKRYKFLARYGRLKYWLEFHIFLCTLGPIMILFHTAFKFGGIVSISFWSMVAVVASGVIGRFIYIQIPRTIEGRELSLNEVKNMQTDLNEVLSSQFKLESEASQRILSATEQASIMEGNILSKMVRQYFSDQKVLKSVSKILLSNNLTRKQVKKVQRLIKNEMGLRNKISRLHTMQEWFKYWHVAHLPFALIMLIIMVIHVAITLAFGYKWIF